MGSKKQILGALRYIAVFLLYIVSGGGVHCADGCVTAHGALRVDGIQLVDQRNAPFQLRGMSSHGLHWFPEYASRPAINETKKWGANLFRLAMYADSQHGGYCDSPEAAERNKRILYNGLRNALAADMYVIVDWHLLADGNPLSTAEQAAAFFAEVTEKFPDHPAILYEICNEPNGDAAWKDICAYADIVIPVIREKSPNAVVLVGTPEHCTNLHAVMDSPLAYPNIMYTYHLYTGYTNYDFSYKLDAMREAGLPVFVSEWGLSVNESTGELDMEQGMAFLDYMRVHRISWANWALANKDESFSAIRSDVSALEGWKETDLTDSGLLVYRALRECAEDK